MVKELEGLTEEDRRALRGSKFAPLPSSSARPPSSSQPRSPILIIIIFFLYFSFVS